MSPANRAARDEAEAFQETADHLAAIIVMHHARRAAANHKRRMEAILCARCDVEEVSREGQYCGQCDYDRHQQDRGARDDY